MNNASRRRVGGLLTVVLLGSTAGCTAGEPAVDGTSPPAETSTPTAPPRSSPLLVRVTRVSGDLADKDRRLLERNVGKVVAEYLDAAFLRRDYPRKSFDDSFRAFSRGAAREAAADKRLLTNAALGQSTVWVRARRQVAYLSVLAPNEVAAGVTARIQVDLEVNRGARPPRRLQLSGRLLLTRRQTGGWQIFGYDIARSTRDAKLGASR